MKKASDLTGRRFGALTAIGEFGRNKWKAILWLCECDCGTITKVTGSNLRNYRTRSCGCTRDGSRRRGASNHKWKGGRLRQRGYVRVLDPSHPRADANGYVLEHIKVMTERLGRQLYENETVHHKNGVRSDNRLDNLELWGSSHPSGQRIADLVEWAEQILATYKKSFSLHPTPTLDTGDSSNNT
jgi:hypothetical protein